MINEIKNQFFSLLRAGIWNVNPDIYLFKEIDWEKLYSVAKSQALLGIILDGIELLPENIRPPRPLYLKWCAEVIEIEDNNKKLDEEVVNLFEILEDNGIRPVLMKGQAAALNYRIPNHRSCGDIDIYIGKKDYDKTNRILSIEGKALEKWSPKHMMYSWHGVTVENHRILANLASPKSLKNLNNIIDEWFRDNSLIKCKIGNKEITVPPTEFDAVFLLLHTVVHLMGLGIGFRQVCDWALFLHRKHNELNKNEIERIAKGLGMWEAWKIFGAFSVKYLGIEKSDLFFPYSPEDEKIAEEVLDDIWENGNFGYLKERKRKLPKGWLQARLTNFVYGQKRLKKLYKVSPREAKWLPYWRFKNFFKRQLGIS